MIRIGVHPTGEEPDQHVVHMAPRVSHTTTVREVPTKSKSGLCSRMKPWLSAIVRPSRHPGASFSLH
jgi:hypothetical protein